MNTALRLRRALAGLALVASGCATPGPNLAPRAIISPTEARFVFPTEHAGRLRWDVPAPHAYEGVPEHSWEVYWNLPEDQVGTQPHALWLVTYWRPGGPREGPVSELIRPFEPWVMRYCSECEGDLPQSEGTADSAVVARVRGADLELRVSGADAVRRLFPQVPDTVRLIRTHRPDATDGRGEEEWRIPVERHH